MSTLNLSPKDPTILAILAIATFWVLTQRRATAATVPGRVQGGQVGRQFFVSPATASLRQAGQSTNAAQNSLISTALTGLLNGLAPSRPQPIGNGQMVYPVTSGATEGINPLLSANTSSADIFSNDAYGGYWDSTASNPALNDSILYTPDYYG